MRIALGQINPTVGDLSGTAAKMIEYARRAADGNADLIVFPELSLNGYPPRDLVEKPSFISRTADALADLTARAPRGVTIVTGYTGRAEQTGRRVYNAAAVILVGPPGAGKTLMAAKMAARAVMDGHKPAVITTDIARAGGVEQLSAFLDILSVPLDTAEDAKSLKSALARASSKDIIVDTGGLNPFDPQEMKLLAQLLAAGKMDPVLILPAGIDAEESAEMALTFEVLGVRKIMPTRLDFARRIGGILSAADKAGLSFCGASHTPQVANGILDLTPEKLAQILMPHPQKAEKEQSKAMSGPKKVRGQK